MWGFVLGTACLVGLIGMGRARHGCGPHGRRWRHGGHPGFHRGFHGHGCGRGGWDEADEEGRAARRAGVGRAVGEMLKRSLRVDDEQEPFVDHALKDAARTLGELRGDAEAARKDLADAFRAETVDDAAVDAALARLDESWKRARRELLSAAKQVHAVLGPEQRAAAADALGSSDRWGF